MHTRAEHDQLAKEGRHPHPPAERVSDVRLWTGFALAPACWAAVLLAGYAISGADCSTGVTAAMVAVHLVALAGAVAGYWVARATRDELHEDGRGKLLASGSPPVPPVAGPASVLGRQRLMAHGGTFLSALSIAMVLGHGAAIVVLGTCR